MKQKNLIWLSATGVIIIIIIGAAVGYFQFARPYVILWQSYHACWRLANPNDAHPYRAVDGLVEMKITPPKKNDSLWLRVRLSWLKPAIFRFNIRTPKGNVCGVYRKNLWLYLPRAKTVLLARAGLPLWKLEGGNSPPVSVQQAIAVSANSPSRESITMKDSLQTRAFRVPASPFTVWWETKATVRGMQTMGGVPCYVVKLRTARGLRKKFKATAVLWIGQKDYLPRKVDVEFNNRNGQWRAVATIARLKLNPPLRKSDFVFSAPGGTKTQVIPLAQVKRFLRALPHFLCESGISGMP